MNKGALRYVADTIAIESLASDLPITKEAGLFEELGFTGVASSIASKVKSLVVEDDSPGGWVKAIANMLATGALFKLHPLLGIVYTVANALGVDVIGIGTKLLSGVYSAVKSGAQTALADVDNYGKIATAAYSKGLVKESQLFGKRKHKEIDIPFLPSKGDSKIQRVFGNLFRVGKRGKIKTLVLAIVIWTLKTALLGAGVVGAGALVAGIIKGKNKKAPETKPEPKKETAPPTGLEELEKTQPESVKKPSNNLKPSGNGNQVFKNDENNIWMVPVIGTIENTLAEWATDVYPQLSGYKNIMYDTPSFTSIVNKLKGHMGNGNHLIMPKGYYSRKQVVDDFVADVSKQLQEIL